MRAAAASSVPCRVLQLGVCGVRLVVAGQSMPTAIKCLRVSYRLWRRGLLVCVEEDTEAGVVEAFSEL